MAQETAALKLKIDALESAQTLKELKKAIKESNDYLIQAGEAGSESYQEMAKAIGAAKEKVKDLREDAAMFMRGGTFNEIANVGQTIAGGFAAAQGAMALFNADSKEVEKSLLKVQAGIAIVQGIRSATEGWESVQRLLNATMLANPYVAATAAIVALGSAIAAVIITTNNSTEKFYENNEALKESKKTRDELRLSIVDLNVELESERGNITKNTAEVLKQQTQQNKEAKALLEKYTQIQKDAADEVYGVWNGLFKSREKQDKEYAEILKKIKKDEADEIKLLSEKQTKEIQLIDVKDKNEKAKIAKSNIDKERDEYDRAQQERVARLKAENKERQRLLEADLKETQSKEKEHAMELLNIEYDTTQARMDTLSELQKIEEAKFTIANAGANSIRSLSMLMQQGSDEAIAFQKTAAIAQIAIDTARSMVSVVRGAAEAAASTGPAAPFTLAAFIGTGIATVLGAVAQAKSVLDTAGGGGGSTPRISSPSGGGGAPNVGVNTFGNQTNLNTNNQGNYQSADAMVVKAYVVEQDITSTQQKVQSIKKKSKY